MNIINNDENECNDYYSNDEIIMNDMMIYNEWNNEKRNKWNNNEEMIIMK